MEKTIQHLEFIKSKFMKKIDLSIFGINTTIDDFFNCTKYECDQNHIDVLYDFFEFIDKIKKQSEIKINDVNEIRKIEYHPLLNFNGLDSILSGLDSILSGLAFVYAFRHKNIIDNKTLGILFRVIGCCELGCDCDENFINIFNLCESYEELYNLCGYLEQIKILTIEGNKVEKPTFIKVWKSLAFMKINMDQLFIKNNNLTDELDKLKLMPPMYHFKGGELFQKSLKEALDTGLVQEKNIVLYCDSLYD